MDGMVLQSATGAVPSLSSSMEGQHELEAMDPKMLQENQQSMAVHPMNQGMQMAHPQVAMKKSATSGSVRRLQGLAQLNKSVRVENPPTGGAAGAWVTEVSHMLKQGTSSMTIHGYNRDHWRQLTAGDKTMQMTEQLMQRNARATNPKASSESWARSIPKRNTAIHKSARAVGLRGRTRAAALASAQLVFTEEGAQRFSDVNQSKNMPSATSHGGKMRTPIDKSKWSSTEADNEGLVNARSTMSIRIRA